MIKDLIVVLDNLGEEAHQKLKSCPYEVSFEKKDLAKATAVIVRSHSVSKELINSIPHLKVISRAGVGMDTIDEEYAISKGIKLCNADGGNSVNAAETTIGLILAIAHKIVYGHTLLHEKKIWERGIDTEGFELENKTLGIIGFGNVGSRVAKFAHSFNMRIIIYDPYVIASEMYVTQVDSLEELLKSSDIITIHTPLTSETNHMITQKELNVIKPTAYIINTSRGKVIDEIALINTLQKKNIAGAALDVFEKEPLALDSLFFKLDNIIMLPHLAGAGIECRKRVSELAIENTIKLLQAI